MQGFGCSSPLPLGGMPPLWDAPVRCSASSTADVPTPVPPPAAWGEGGALDLSSLLRHDLGHALCHYLDRKGFASLQISSKTMEASSRNVLRVRNRMLPARKRLENLDGVDFCVGRVVKEIMRLEGRHPLDIVSTGGAPASSTVGGPYVENKVIRLDLVTSEHVVLAPLRESRDAHATVALGDRLYVIGGFDAEDPLRSVESAGLVGTGHWSEVAPMITPRWHHGATVLEGKIYVAGGCPLDTAGSRVERFDAVTNQWTELSPLTIRREGHCLVSALGEVYAVGGVQSREVGADFEYTPVKTVERYQPSTGLWRPVASLRSGRYRAAAVVLGDKLYLIGGWSSATEVLRSVECLDLSVPDAQWTPVAPMDKPRHGMVAVATGGKIYVAGGLYYRPRIGWPPMECFDPSAGPVGRWTIMPLHSGFPRFAVLTAC